MTRHFAGIDIGSRTVKLVVLEDNQVTHTDVRENSFDPISLARVMIAGQPCESIVATGYGRHLFSRHFQCDVISEIKAFSLGATQLLPSCRTILDIGGQDTKAIALDQLGKIKKFEMNDKCAAGTGKFLEIMAMALGFTLEEFAEAALTSPAKEKINSMCTVFAESEVVSMISRGVDRNAVARGLHASVAARAAAMLQRVSIAHDVVFCGGAALNPCIHKLLESELGLTLLVPQQPQIVGALGAAFYAYYSHEGRLLNSMAVV